MVTPFGINAILLDDVEEHEKREKGKKGEDWSFFPSIFIYWKVLLMAASREDHSK